ncbi:MAG: HAD-IA family hydrolase [Deltaproteobacteria bacterium]|nr:HAD-IA family hydrolase [Deltaproteobacteria bacterium]
MTYLISPDTQGLIFDFDGTIVDSMPMHYLSWRESFAHFNADFPKDFFYETAGVTLPDIVSIYNQRYGTALDAEVVVMNKEIAHAKYLLSTPIIPEVMSVIEKYYDVVPMAIATGNSKKLTEPLIVKLGLKKYFKAIVYGEDVTNPKPDPECFLKAASLLNVHASQCEVFEDGDAGLTGARRAGMKAVDVRPWLNSRR